MPTFLSDPPPAVFVAFVLAVLAVGGLWVRYRRRSLLVAAAVILAVLLLLVGIASLSESPREQAVRRVTDMAAALTERNWPRFADHVSESFAAGGLTKADLKKGFDLGTQYQVRAAVWEFDLAEPVVYTADTVAIRFDAKADSPHGQTAKHFQATFAKDPDGQFRMRTFTPFNYVQKKVAEPIPGVTR